MLSNRKRIAFQAGLATLAAALSTALILSGVEKLHDTSDRMH